MQQCINLIPTKFSGHACGLQSPSHDMQFPTTLSIELMTILVTPTMSYSRLIPITAHVQSLYMYVSSCVARADVHCTVWCALIRM